MKCRYCGKEIANDSVFCEFCGRRVQKKSNLKPLWITLGILAGIFLVSFFTYVIIDATMDSSEYPIDPVPVDTIAYDADEVYGYVDLGLPSGTKWKSDNESGFYDYDEAISRFGSKLPTKEQMEELKNKCKWEWQGNGYKVIGLNGNSIVLPASGFRGCSGDVNDVGSDGYYWSSTPNGSDDAWYLDFGSGYVGMDYCYRCYGQSVRLVQD